MSLDPNVLLLCLNLKLYWNFDHPNSNNSHQKTTYFTNHLGTQTLNTQELAGENRIFQNILLIFQNILFYKKFKVPSVSALAFRNRITNSLLSLILTHVFNKLQVFKIITIHKYCFKKKTFF